MEHCWLPELAQHFEKFIAFSTTNLGHFSLDTVNPCRNARAWTLYKWQSRRSLGATWTPENTGWVGELLAGKYLESIPSFKRYTAKTQLLFNRYSWKKKHLARELQSLLLGHWRQQQDCSLFHHLFCKPTSKAYSPSSKMGSVSTELLPTHWKFTLTWVSYNIGIRWNVKFPKFTIFLSLFSVH